MQIPFFKVSRSSSLLGNALSLPCLFTFFSALSLQICNADDPRMCDSALYANGSQFERNLNTVLNNLVHHTSGGYNTSVSGQIPNRIYGLLQCRGDLSMEDCYSCSRDAKASILQVCPNAAGGRIWKGTCYMRYANYSFIGQLDLNSAPIYYNVNNATNPETFSRSVRGLFLNLSDKAPFSEKKFATDSTKDLESFEKINGLVQCWQDISTTDCESCLTSAISELLGVTRAINVGGVCYLGSCMARYETYPFFTETPPSPPPSLPPPSVDAPTPSFPPRDTRPTASPEKSSNKTTLVGGVVGVSFVMFLVGVAIFAKRRKLKAAVFGRPIRQEDRAMDEDSLIPQDRPTIFNLETLKNATRNFHNDNKLGEGGFGPVYKGTLTDGKEIAVKKLSLKSRQGKEEFLNELKLVAKLQHKNLVHIYGCCVEGPERLIVYEYLPNNSLDKLLFDSQGSKQLDWEMRLNILLGIARGLVYLHDYSRKRIIHRDIKASNILLDQRMNPKISDFGLARLFAEDETHVTTKVAGTLGYMAPEYAMRGQLSVKVDVYSFGVLLLEIICGRKNTDYKLSTENQILNEVVWRSFQGRNVLDLIDRKVVDKCGQEEAAICIHVGLLCTQGDPCLRPTMSTVYSMLSNPTMINLPHPTKPAFVNITNEEIRSHTVTVSSRAASTSINDASVTDVGGR